VIIVFLNSIQIFNWWVNAFESYIHSADVMCSKWNWSSEIFSQDAAKYCVHTIRYLFSKHIFVKCNDLFLSLYGKIRFAGIISQYLIQISEKNHVCIHKPAAKIILVREHTHWVTDFVNAISYMFVTTVDDTCPPNKYAGQIMLTKIYSVCLACRELDLFPSLGD
jgi:hypothetical protein